MTHVASGTRGVEREERDHARGSRPALLAPPFPDLRCGATTPPLRGGGLSPTPLRTLAEWEGEDGLATRLRPASGNCLAKASEERRFGRPDIFSRKL